MSSIVAMGVFQGGFDQVFGFGARDQDVRSDAEFAAVEFLAAGDVLGRHGPACAGADSGRSGSTRLRGALHWNERRARRGRGRWRGRGGLRRLGGER